MRLTVTPSPPTDTPVRVSPPDEVTLSTCIGCGAMSLPARCPDGCAQERKLELVAAGELDELIALTERAEERAAALARAVVPFARPRCAHRNGARTSAAAGAALATHGPVEARLRQLAAQPVEAVVSWWCPQCGGVDAPQPCLGVCIRAAVRWASAERARETQARAGAAVKRVDALRAVLVLAAHVRPQPGQERRHWDAVQRRAQHALTG